MEKKRIFLVGYMGSGKTTLGKMLAPKLGLSFIDLDAFIEQKYFKTISDIFKEKGEDAFREMERAALREVSEFEDILVATGGGTPCFFDNMQRMNACGTTVYLQCTPAFLADGLKKGRQKRPLISGMTDDELRRFIGENLSRRHPFYAQAALHVNADADIRDMEAEILAFFRNEKCSD